MYVIYVWCALCMSLFHSFVSSFAPSFACVRILGVIKYNYIVPYISRSLCLSLCFDSIFYFSHFRRNFILFVIYLAVTISPFRFSYTNRRACCASSRDCTPIKMSKVNFHESSRSFAHASTTLIHKMYKARIMRRTSINTINSWFVSA